MLHKKGTPNKIKEVVTGDTNFDALKNKIAKDNNLKRCRSCGQLLAKFDAENKTINVQKKGLDLIAETSSAQIRCPSCGEVNKV